MHYSKYLWIPSYLAGSSPTVLIKKIKRFHYGIKIEVIQENKQAEKPLEKK